MDNYKVEYIIFEKDKISLNNALDWIVNNNYKVKKTDETETQYRFRQFNNKYLKRKGYKNAITKKLNEVVSLIIVFNF